MKKYFRVMLGAKSVHAEQCHAEGFIGTDFLIAEDLTRRLPDDFRAFNNEFIPIYLRNRPDKTRIGAGLSCGALWTVSKGIKNGDVVLCPDGSGRYRTAEVAGDYFFQAGAILPHRRPVRWLNQPIDRTDMSVALRKSTTSGTVVDVTGYAEEIEKLLAGIAQPALLSTDETVEDLAEFAMEKHLEEFMVANWGQTEFGRDYDIYEEDGERVGQQYQSDTGPLDILAVSKDQKRLLVVELKKGRASDAVVGQVLRYMGFVKEVLAESDQEVKGAIIALDDDQRMRRALAMVSNVDFYRYEVSFKLVRA